MGWTKVTDGLLARIYGVSQTEIEEKLQHLSEPDQSQLRQVIFHQATLLEMDLDNITEDDVAKLAAIDTITNFWGNQLGIRD